MAMLKQNETKEKSLWSRKILEAVTINIVFFLFQGFDYATANTPGYSQDNVRTFHVFKNQKADYLVGFNPQTQKTQNNCIRTKKKLKIRELGGEPARSHFEYVETLQEMLDKEELDFEVGLQVNYIVSASVDVRLSEMSEHTSFSNMGFVYWSYRNLHNVKWVMNKEFVLTEEAQVLHDKAAINQNWNKFYKECGTHVIINKQHEDFFMGTLTFNFSESSSASKKSTAVDAMIGFANIAKAKTSVKKARQSYNKIKSSRQEIDAIWSGDPVGFKNPTSVADVIETYKNFPSLKNNTEYSAFGVVPYSVLVKNWGDIDGMESISKKRRNKVRTIADGLDFQGRAIIKLKKSTHKHARQALTYIKQDLNRARKTFVSEKACLYGIWSLKCDDLLQKYKPWKKKAKKNINDFVKNMLNNSQTCPQKKHAPKMVLVNPNGFITCRQCKLGEKIVFANGKNGRCGRLDPPKGKKSVRLGLKELANPKKISGGEAGVFTIDNQYPDICTKRGKKCGKPRADQICKKLGFKESSYFATINYSRTRYANNKQCLQSKEDQKPLPEKCRTFVTLDCVR